MLAVEILVQAVVVASPVFQQQRRRARLPRLVAAREEGVERVGKAGRDAEVLVPAIGDLRQRRVEARTQRRDRLRQRRGEVFVLALAEAMPPSRSCCGSARRPRSCRSAARRSRPATAGRWWRSHARRARARCGASRGRETMARASSAHFLPRPSGERRMPGHVWRTWGRRRASALRSLLRIGSRGGRASPGRSCPRRCAPLRRWFGHSAGARPAFRRTRC